MSEKRPAFDFSWKSVHCSVLNPVLSEILTGHIMVSVFLWESSTEFQKHVPQADGGVSGAHGELHARLNKPITVK